MNAGVSLAYFELVLVKLWHAFIFISVGKGLMSPCNKVLEARPSMVYLHRNEHLWTTIEDIRTLLVESMLELTQCNELVMG